MIRKLMFSEQYTYKDITLWMTDLHDGFRTKALLYNASQNVQTSLLIKVNNKEVIYTMELQT